MGNLVATFTIRSGQLRLVYDGLYERQPDGAMLLAVEHSGFREAAG